MRYSLRGRGTLSDNHESSNPHDFKRIKEMSDESKPSALSFQCFKCGKLFEHDLSRACESCGFDKCPRCGACYCSLDGNERRVADAVYYSLPAWLGA
jgi:hypothetical protein